jgi:hypothetical protein
VQHTQTDSHHPQRQAPPSGDVVALIAEAKRAAQRADNEATAPRAVAMDPTLSRADVADARRQMEDALFRRDRAKAAIERLGDRLGQLRHLEDQARRREAYDKAKAERDELGKELWRT